MTDWLTGRSCFIFGTVLAATYAHGSEIAGSLLVVALAAADVVLARE